MSQIRVHIHEHTGTIMLSRPEKRNALTRQMMAEIGQAFRDLHLEKKVRAVVLTGGGPSFCAGMDLGEMSETAKQPDAYALWEQDARAYRELVEAMLRFPKPIIAAVDGAAVAGGMGLVLASDIVVASSAAKFGLPEPKRGLVAGMVTPLLNFRLGGSRAAYLLLTGRLIGAEEALRIGLAHEVVAPEQIWARSHQIAAECSESAPEALGMTKKMLNETIGDHLETLLAAGAALSSAARTTEAAKEGLAAFLEKRPPQWK
ncbi:MAG: enoyl-CoA hydratase/isomerase family protein [Planctomycetia bacterium]|nr:enoyl-CoA hydratase/isomerase family protein [Planctomycetia bacterium]